MPDGSINPLLRYSYRDRMFWPPFSCCINFTLLFSMFENTRFSLSGSAATGIVSAESLLNRSVTPPAFSRSNQQQSS